MIGHRTVVCLIAPVAMGMPRLVIAQHESLGPIDDLRASGEFEEALNRLERLSQQHPNDASILWRLAWTRIDIGEREAGASSRPHYERALREARRALDVDDHNARAHMVRAMAAGRVALEAGNRERIQLSREVKDHVDRAIELDPSLDGAYHIRGRWNHEIASLGFFTRSIVRVVYGGLPDASYEAAAEDFRRAIRIRDRVIHRLELGRTLMELSQMDAAREHLSHALEMQDDDPDAESHRGEAQRLLDSIR